MTVRTRIAPSPTGDPHVGTAYIALFNLCFARQHQGQFVLRIEDTDQARSTDDSEKMILDSLKWLGLEWDEGPDVGGAYGPYRQSERMDIYAGYAEQLVERGYAFKCYRTPEELDNIREAKKQNGDLSALNENDLKLDDRETQNRVAAGQLPVIRLKVPERGVCRFKDGLRGEIEIEWSRVDAQILLKTDGMPTYHLANVVDDHLMKITHVLRGEEWINSAPKHQLLYEYFGWEMPALIHLPLLRNPDKSKLSKRKNPTSILFYKKMGFLPEALVNYLGRMGWSMPDEREKFTLQEMLAHFDISRVSLGGPVFDVEKLRWLNACWIREELDTVQLAEKLRAWAFSEENILPVLSQLHQRIEVLSDVAPQAAFMFSGLLDLQEQDFLSASRQERDELLTHLQFTLWRLEALRHWTRETIFSEIKQLSESLQIKLKDFLPPIFVAIAGSTASFSVMDAMALLGPDMSRARLRHAIEVLGGVSKKQMKRLEKDYQALQQAVLP
ncbi:MAG: glutamate--tRNA ligase [Pseudomonadales bacterium]|nr:glutamate--tRNA ligase [Pseudomonadales bacterium]